MTTRGVLPVVTCPRGGGSEGRLEQDVGAGAGWGLGIYLSWLVGTPLSCLGWRTGVIPLFCPCLGWGGAGWYLSVLSGWSWYLLWSCLGRGGVPPSWLVSTPPPNSTPSCEQTYLWKHNLLSFFQGGISMVECIPMKDRMWSDYHWF